MVGIDLSFHPNLHADLSTCPLPEVLSEPLEDDCWMTSLFSMLRLAFFNRRVEAAETVAHADAEPQEVVLAPHAQRTEIVGVGSLRGMCVSGV